MTLSATPRLIQILAAIAGLPALLLPLAGLLLSSRRAAGRSIGSGSALRRWPLVALIMVGFIVLGYLLWKPLPLAIGGWLKPALLALGSLLYFPAIALYLWGWAALGREFGVSTTGGAGIYADHHLVRSGPYRWVRHPMYLAVMAAAGGALLIFQTWAMLLFAPLSLVVVRRAEQEEALLEEAFGAEWREYRGEVPKWLPRRSKS